LYTYDAWVKILSIKDGNGNEITSDTNIGKLNSLRYRSNYYDTETDLYYLQSRYYDSEWGRFINTDNTGILTQADDKLLITTLFSYCLNNPINMIDIDGYSPLRDAINDGYKFMDEVYNKFAGFKKNTKKTLTKFGN